MQYVSEKNDFRVPAFQAQQLRNRSCTWQKYNTVLCGQGSCPMFRNLQVLVKIACGGIFDNSKKYTISVHMFQTWRLPVT